MSRKPVLLLGFGDQHDTLAGRLLLLNLRPVRARLVEDAVAALSSSGVAVRAALLPVAHPFGELRDALDSLRRAAGALEFIVTGPRPDLATLERLRAAGVRFGLFEPYNDSELRFVVNQALYDRTRGDVRGDLRVPTGMVARVFSAAGEKAALLYNLSVGGAFLETSRPTASGGHVRVELPLPSGHLTLEARVVSTNVPGNLQRPQLPLGMGVRFGELGAEPRRELEKFVSERARAFLL